MSDGSEKTLDGFGVSDSKLHVRLLHDLRSWEDGSPLLESASHDSVEIRRSIAQLVDYQTVKISTLQSGERAPVFRECALCGLIVFDELLVSVSQDGREANVQEIQDAVPEEDDGADDGRPVFLLFHFFFFSPLKSALRSVFPEVDPLAEPVPLVPAHRPVFQ